MLRNQFSHETAVRTCIYDITDTYVVKKENSYDAILLTYVRTPQYKMRLATYIARASYVCVWGEESVASTILLRMYVQLASHIGVRFVASYPSISQVLLVL